MGYRMEIYPNQIHRAAIFAAKEVLRILKEDGGTERYEDRMVSWLDRNITVGLEWWKERQKKYLEGLE